METKELKEIDQNAKEPRACETLCKTGENRRSGIYQLKSENVESRNGKGKIPGWSRLI